MLAVQFPAVLFPAVLFPTVLFPAVPMLELLSLVLKQVGSLAVNQVQMRVTKTVKETKSHLVKGRKFNPLAVVKHQVNPHLVGIQQALTQ